MISILDSENDINQSESTESENSSAVFAEENSKIAKNAKPEEKKTLKISKKAKNAKKRVTSIGGQAVLEGVMMRGATAEALAVRDEDGVIRLETKRVKPIKERNVFFRLPIIRGVYSFLQSLIGGTACLMRSADVYGEGEPSKFEKWVSEKLKVNVMSVVSGISLIVGLALAIVLFMWLPQLVRGLFERWFLGEGKAFGVWAKNFIEGGLKLLIFVSYILLCSLLKDVRRTFMYHGAEHKTISCYEKGLPLTVENARGCTRVHDRCGTTFIVFVLVISIIVFACFESLVGKDVLTGALRVLCKLLLLPVVAGLSYELLKALAKTKSPLVLPLKAPGLLLQRITTKEPTDDMLEVAITAFNAVLEMDENPEIPERKFVTAEKRKELVERVAKELKEAGIEERAEAEWIVSLKIGVKRDELDSEKLVSPSLVESVNALVKERASGRPLWYCVGDTDFYGYKIKVDERVLIPRPETELLVENALGFINKDSEVLDLCTGSGAIAIAVQKESGARVTASDISTEAISLATENAKLNCAEIEFLQSDAFENLKGREFDVIISNPPYIKTGDIDGLQKEISFEPKIALDGGDDGLDFYRIIAKTAKKHLKKGGALFLEIGETQAEEVVKLLKKAEEIKVIKDYEGKDRIIKAVY